MRRGGPQHMQVDAVQATREASRAVVRSGNLILRNRWAGGMAGLWLFGLLVVFVLPAPISETDEMLSAYESKHVDVQAVNDKLGRVEHDMYERESRYHNERVRICLRRCGMGTI